MKLNSSIAFRASKRPGDLFELSVADLILVPGRHIAKLPDFPLCDAADSA